MGALPIFLALVLATASAHKLARRERLAVATAKLTGLPLATGAVASLGAAAVEGVAALALLLPETRAIGALVAAVLWTGYAGLLVRNIGRSLDCGCSFGAREKPVGAALVAKAGGLAILALIVGLTTPAPVTVDAPFAALGFLALYLALDELLAIPSAAWRTN